MTNVRVNSEGKKLYPFSMLKYGHDIELAYNHQRIICWEMEDGERAWDDKAFDWLEKLGEAYGHAAGAPIAWVTGKDYGTLWEAACWAECYRDGKN